MSTTYLLFAYAALTLAFWAHALRGLRAYERARPRERLFGLEQRILIAAVALVASAGWIVLLPIAAAGRAHLAFERHARPLVSRAAHWRGPRVARA